MKHIFLLIAILASAFNIHAQQYRVVYTDESLPELYDEITIRVEERIADGSYRPVRKGYMLSTSDAELHGKKLTIDYSKLYAKHGIVDFMLQYNEQSTPVKLELPILESIRYNLYADSIKPIMNYYLNVEGVYTNGRIYPLDQNYITVASDKGKIEGMEWIKPEKIDFDRVRFHATHNFAEIPAVDTIVFIKQYKDPRDKME